MPSFSWRWLWPSTKKKNKKFGGKRERMSYLYNLLQKFFAFLLNSKNIVKMSGIPLWTNLMMFSAGVFAIGIMLPLFVTSFRLIRKKMTGKKWKSLQEFAYIFYAMVFVQVIMVYISKPSSLVRNINLAFYCLVFISYTFFKVKIIMEKKFAAKKASLAVK